MVEEDNEKPSRPAADPRARANWRDRLGRLWRADPTGMSVEFLRLGIGVIWVLNFLFIVVPSNEFFVTFRGTTLSFAPTSLGGPGVADFVAAHATFFAWLIALLTFYLAVAFLLGFTTRLACLVGSAASVIFLATQFLSTFSSPGGTDVGPHPLYLLAYLILFAGGAGRYLSLDSTLMSAGPARFPRLRRWFAGPGR